MISDQAGQGPAIASDPVQGRYKSSRRSSSSRHDLARPVDQESSLLTLRDAAALLAVSYWTIRGWIETGKLPAIRLSKKLVRINREDLRTFVAAHRDG